MNSTSAPPDGRARSRVVVLDDWEHVFSQAGALHALAERIDLHIHTQPLRGADLDHALAGVEVLILNRDRTPIDAQRIQRMSQLRYVIFTGPRNGTLDMAALEARGIPASGTEGGPARETTAEHTWALILTAMRRLDQQLADMRRGRWRSPTPVPLPGALHGTTLGLLGLGNIGARIARYAHAFGMPILAWSPNLTPQRAAEHNARAVSLETLLAEARIVSLHLVAAPGTHHLINATRLAQMRSDAILVNTSRGSLIDTDALVSALRRGRPAVAALDVYETEPFPTDHPLLAEPNALLSPHTGFISEPAAQAFVAGVLEALTAWLNDQTLPRRVGKA